MLYFSDENGNLIPIATDNQGNTKLIVDMLWENPQPCEPFVGQTISIPNIMDYKLILIQGNTLWRSDPEGGSQALIATDTIKLLSVNNSNYYLSRGTLIGHTTTNNWLVWRNFYVTETGIVFSSSGNNNEECVPNFVLGIK